ncbi:unnamed protein product [Effrenium voratum]|nr:unnamed protein product [Effrenium voratum]
MTYNDRSCLENMSCARLWEIVKQPRCAIFKPLSANQYNVARKACVQAILNTDNAQHFQSVKKVQMFYEMNSEVLTAAAEMYRESLEEDEEPVFPMPEVSEVFKEASNKQTLINLMVHLADTSNACKPFRICQTWVQKAMEENFLQGDEEKLLGLPVQALNDREKANLPHSQIGFIEYLVAPFLLVVIKVLPPADALQAQLLINVKTWEKLWQQQGPSDEEKQKVAARVKESLRVNLNALGDKARSSRQLRNLYGAAVNEYDVPNICFSLDDCFLYVTSSLPQPSGAREQEEVVALCGQVAIFELRTAQLVLQLPCHQKAVRCFDRHPFTEMLVTGSFDKTVKFWS